MPLFTDVILILVRGHLCRGYISSYTKNLSRQGSYFQLFGTSYQLDIFGQRTNPSMILSGTELTQESKPKILSGKWSEVCPVLLQNRGLSKRNNRISLPARCILQNSFSLPYSFSCSPVFLSMSSFFCWCDHIARSTGILPGHCMVPPVHRRSFDWYFS